MSEPDEFSVEQVIQLTLTGNIRHRIETRLFRKPLLVLQVMKY